MFQNDAYSTYKENSAYTASQEELTLMLYNGLIKFIMQAQKAIDENDVQGAHEKIIKSQDILQYLLNTLDNKYEIANKMASLYDYMHWRLIDANMKKDKQILEEVLGFAREFRDTWSQAMKIAKVDEVTYPEKIAK